MSDDYDDDFENYDDDFEDDEAEHEDVFGLPTKQSPVPSPERGGVSSSVQSLRAVPQQQSPGLSTRGLGVQLPTGHLLVLTDSQRRQRTQNLLAAKEKQTLVKLEIARIDDMFIMSRKSTYQLYDMRRSVYANMRVAACLTHEDAKDDETQTEEVDARAFACQVPDDRNTVSAAANGGDGSGAGGPAGGVVSLTQLEAGIDNKLTAFISWAGPVMLAALGMAPTRRPLSIPSNPSNGGFLSAGRITLTQGAFLNGRPVIALAFCPGSLPWLLAAYGPVGAEMGPALLLKDHTINTKGMLAVWDLSAPQTPHALLLCEGIPSCVCWAPASSDALAFAGLEEGGVAVWDLEGSTVGLQTQNVLGVDHVLRLPSFSTEFLAGSDGNAASIVGIVTATRTGEGGDSKARPCQLITVNTWGSVVVYSVSISAPDRTISANTELGMRIGSRVRLVQMASGLRLGPAPQAELRRNSLLPPVQAFSLQVLSQQSQVIVGTEGGRVLRGSWIGVPPAPKEFQILETGSTEEATISRRVVVPTHVTALHVSPFFPDTFIAGHDNGTISMHSTTTSAPTMVWPEAAKSAIRVLRWCPTRPSSFVALDSLSTVYCFDLTRSRTAAVHAEVFVLNAGKKGAQPSFAQAMGTSEFVGSDMPPCFALGYDDGTVDCHMLGVQMAKPVANEMTLMANVLPSTRDLKKNALNGVRV